MIIENNGTRAFRAWTATDLGGDWEPLAGADNARSHPSPARPTSPGRTGNGRTASATAIIVRERIRARRWKSTPAICRCSHQGRDPSQNPSHIDLPYRPGLLDTRALIARGEVCR